MPGWYNMEAAVAQSAAEEEKIYEQLLYVRLPLFSWGIPTNPKTPWQENIAVVVGDEEEEEAEEWHKWELTLVKQERERERPRQNTDCHVSVDLIWSPERNNCDGVAIGWDSLLVVYQEVWEELRVDLEWGHYTTPYLIERCVEHSSFSRRRRMSWEIHSKSLRRIHFTPLSLSLSHTLNN